MTLKQLSHKLTAYFQASLSVLFIVEYFYVLQAFLFGRVKVPGEYHDMIIALIGVLTGSVATIVTFWFNRQRASAGNGDDAQSPDWQALARWLAQHHLPPPPGMQPPSGSATPQPPNTPEPVAQ